ncbi:MAG: hypothetical protein ACOYXC_09840 [Candidatus Rifleibacteriota bacterium]
MNKIFLLILPLFIFLNLAAMAQTEESPTAEVEKMLQNVALPGDAIESLILDMRMNLPLPMTVMVQLRYQAPVHYSLNVFDGSDLTPMMIIRGTRAMINDPLAEAISLIASAGVAFDLSHQGEDLNANFAFNLPTDGAVKNRVNLDFKTIFSKITKNCTLEKVSEDELLFRGETERKSSCIASFLTQQSFPLHSLQMFVEGSSQPILEFPLISTLIPPGAECFAFPETALKETGISAANLEPVGMIDTMMVVASVMKAIFLRAAVKNPAIRTDLEKNFNISPDWPKIEAQDKQRSELLKKVFQPF